MQKPTFQELTNEITQLIHCYQSADPEYGTARAYGAVQQMLVMMLEQPNESSAQIMIDFIRSRSIELAGSGV